MKDIKISPSAEAALTEILEYSIERWGRARADDYKNQLLNRVKSVARAEPPHPKRCDVLMRGKRKAASLVYCREGRHFIILRETVMRIDVVEFIHESRNLERLIDGLVGKAREKDSS